MRSSCRAIAKIAVKKQILHTNSQAIVMRYSLLEKPYFLVGAERSGTTVLRLMLHHHSSIAWCNEFEYSVDPLVGQLRWPLLQDYYNWLETHRIFQASGFEIDPDLDYPTLVNSFLCQHRDRDSKPIIGATVHRHFDQILRIWPDARFIHLLRDGRDVSRSCIGMGWAGNVWTGVERWIEAEQLWATLKALLTPDRYIEITYESLIANPQDVLTEVCNFMGISYEEAMLAYDESTTYDTPDPRFVAQWRRKLSDREIQLVESRIADMLVERGYELSGLPLITVPPFMKKLLEVHDWLERFKFRLKRNGLDLFVADFLSRKLGLTQWQKRVRLKLNQVEAAHLK